MTFSRCPVCEIPFVHYMNFGLEIEADLEKKMGIIKIDYNFITDKKMHQLMQERKSSKLKSAKTLLDSILKFDLSYDKTIRPKTHLIKLM